MRTDKIYLVGFMAAGKSSVGRALADRLGWGLEDIDQLIEAREGRPIPEIFALRGEPYFRSLERELLRLIRPLRHIVVATGGGTFAEPDNLTAINLDGLSVWLDVPLSQILARLPADPPRPLASEDREHIERLYAKRRLAYQQAHLRLDAGSASISELVEQIVKTVASNQ